MCARSRILRAPLPSKRATTILPICGGVSNSFTASCPGSTTSTFPPKAARRSRSRAAMRSRPSLSRLPDSMPTSCCKVSMAAGFSRWTAPYRGSSGAPAAPGANAAQPMRNGAIRDQPSTGATLSPKCARPPPSAEAGAATTGLAAAALPAVAPGVRAGQGAGQLRTVRSAHVHGHQERAGAVLILGRRATESRGAGGGGSHRLRLRVGGEDEAREAVREVVEQQLLHAGLAVGDVAGVAGVRTRGGDADVVEVDAEVTHRPPAFQG